MPTKCYILWAYRGHNRHIKGAYCGHIMGISWAWRYELKMTDVVSVGNKSRGFKGVCNTPLAKSANALRDISLYFALQPSRRDSLQGKETSLAERGNLPGKQALRIKMIHKKIA